MKSDDRSILSRMSSWLRVSSKSNRILAQEYERLRSEQARLSAELEFLLSSYDQKTRALASRIAEANEDVTDDEMREMYEDQLHLWRIIRRLQIAERNIPQLEQEYMEWKGRNTDELSSSHPDHANARMEFIASELRARGRSVPSNNVSDSFEGSAKDADPFEDLQLNDALEFIESSDDSQNDTLKKPSVIPITEDMHQALLDQIRECGRQINKQNSPRELAELYRELRQHHAHLREADRRIGTKRYRVVLHR